MRRLKLATLAALAFLALAALPSNGEVVCVEYGVGTPYCQGFCDFYDSETGEYQGTIEYKC